MTDHPQEFGISFKWWLLIAAGLGLLGVLMVVLFIPPAASHGPADLSSVVSANENASPAVSSGPVDVAKPDADLPSAASANAPKATAQREDDGKTAAEHVGPAAAEAQQAQQAVMAGRPDAGNPTSAAADSTGAPAATTPEGQDARPKAVLAGGWQIIFRHARRRTFAYEHTRSSATRWHLPAPPGFDYWLVTSNLSWQGRRQQTFYPTRAGQWASCFSLRVARHGVSQSLDALGMVTGAATPLAPFHTKSFDIASGKGADVTVAFLVPQDIDSCSLLAAGQEVEELAVVAQRDENVDGEQAARRADGAIGQWRPSPDLLRGVRAASELEQTLVGGGGEILTVEKALAGAFRLAFVPSGLEARGFPKGPNQPQSTIELVAGKRKWPISLRLLNEGEQLLVYIGEGDQQFALLYRRAG